MNRQPPDKAREDLNQLLFLGERKKTAAAMLHTATATYLNQDKDIEEPPEKKLERINDLLEIRGKYINEINLITTEMQKLHDLLKQSPTDGRTGRRLEEYPQWQAYQKVNDDTLDLLTKTREIDNKLRHCLEELMTTLLGQLKELHLKKSSLKSYEAAGEQLKGCFVNQEVF